MKHIWHDVNSSPVRVTGTECSLCYCNTRHSIYAHYPVHSTFLYTYFHNTKFKNHTNRRTWFLRPALAKGTILLHKQKPEGDGCVTEEAEPGGGGAGSRGLILVYRLRRTGTQPADLNMCGGVASLIVVYSSLACQFQASVREQHPPHRDSRPQDHYFCGSTKLSYSLWSSSYSWWKDKECDPLKQHLSSIHILWSNVSHKKN